VPQDVLLFPHLSVEQNITYAAPRRADVDPNGLADLLGLDALLSRKVSSLSGGERQRVALARALHSGPDVLLLDEPLAAVDLKRRRTIVDALVAIRDDLHLPLLYVTHSPDEVRLIADYAVILDEGKVVAVGKPEEVLM
jgi:molybdate transport system ATP-binding protein